MRLFPSLQSQPIHNHACRHNYTSHIQPATLTAGATQPATLAAGATQPATLAAGATQPATFTAGSRYNDPATK
jgi:hypothetical protein